MPRRFILFDELDPDEYMDAEIIKQLIIIENNYLEKQWEDISRSRELAQTLLAVVKYRKSPYSHLNTKKINPERELRPWKSFE